MKFFSLLVLASLMISSAFAAVTIKCTKQGRGVVKAVVQGIKQRNGRDSDVNFYVQYVDYNGKAEKASFDNQVRSKSGTAVNTMNLNYERDQVMAKVLNYNGNGNHEKVVCPIYKNL